MCTLKQSVSLSATALGIALLLSSVGCKKSPVAPTDAFAQNPAADSSDPASINMAPVAAQRTSAAQPARILGEREEGYNGQQGEQYPETDPYNNQVAAGEQALDEADQAPPPLPTYEQPPVTRANTIWTPGYWHYARTGYYWVPGAYVQPPYSGALWTPGYWAADGSHYRFHAGYWGRHVGFYGGVPYGGGYTGTGYRGGYWNGGRFYYNQAVNRVDANLVPTVYNQPERMEYPYGRASFNGGAGGIPIVPIAAELIALHEQHERGVRYQYEVDRQARFNRAQFYEVNHGRPETYFADDNYLAARPAINRVDERGFRPGIEHREIVRQPVIVERQVIVEHDGFPGRGHAYGHDKDHGDHDHGHGHDHDDDHGDGHGHGEGHGHDR